MNIRLITENFFFTSLLSFKKRIKKLSLIKLILVYLSLISTWSAFSQVDDNNGPRELPKSVLRKVSVGIDSGVNSQRFRLSSAFFDIFSDIDVFEENLGRFVYGLSLGRVVYDNHDLTDSWTVADFFTIPIGLPLENSIDIPLNGMSAKVSLSSRIEFNIVNIRQVAPRNYVELIRDKKEKNEELKQKLRSLSSKDSNHLIHLDSDLDSDEIEEEVDRSEDEELQAQDFEEGNETNTSRLVKRKDKWPWKNVSPGAKARYSRLLNTLAHPFRLPVTKRGVKNLDHGEIYSYGISGIVQLDGSVGWSTPEVLGSESVSAGVGLTTYLKGNFRVSIMKESDKLVRVKLTKLHEYGYSANLGKTGIKYEVFQGFLITDKRVAKVKETLIPFHLRVKKGTQKTFDVVYQYDISKESGMKAYLLASKGLFSLSHKYQLISESGVKKLFIRKQTLTRKEKTHKLYLSIFLNKRHRTRKENAAARIEIGEKEHLIFKGISENAKGISTIWGAREKKVHRFDFILRDEKFISPDDILFFIEGDIEDRKTSGRELFKYTRHIKKTLGREIFPELPFLGPLEDCTEEERENAFNEEPCGKKRIPLNIGKSDFFYRAGFNYAQLQKFIHLPEDEMWNQLAKAFHIKESKWENSLRRLTWLLGRSVLSLLNVPLSYFDIYFRPGGKIIQAHKIFRNWKKLSSIKNYKKLSAKLTKMLNTRYFSEEITQLMVNIMGAPVNYIVNLSAPKLFPRIKKHFNTSSGEEDFQRFIDREIDFNLLRKNYSYDSRALLRGLSTKVKGDKLVIKFELTQDPQYLFFQIDKRSTFSKYKRLTKFIFKNTSKSGELVFKKGINTIEISKTSRGPLESEFAKVIFNNKWNRLRMAYSIDNDNWGKIESSKFKILNKKRPNDSSRPRRNNR